MYWCDLPSSLWLERSLASIEVGLPAATSWRLSPRDTRRYPRPVIRWQSNTAPRKQKQKKELYARRLTVNENDILRILRRSCRGSLFLDRRAALHRYVRWRRCHRSDDGGNTVCPHKGAPRAVDLGAAAAFVQPEVLFALFVVESPQVSLRQLLQ